MIFGYNVNNSHQNKLTLFIIIFLSFIFCFTLTFYNTKKNGLLSYGALICDRIGWRCVVLMPVLMPVMMGLVLMGLVLIRGQGRFQHTDVSHGTCVGDVVLMDGSFQHLDVFLQVTHPATFICQCFFQVTLKETLWQEFLHLLHDHSGCRCGCGCGCGCNGKGCCAWRWQRWQDRQGCQFHEHRKRGVHVAWNLTRRLSTCHSQKGK